MGTIDILGGAGTSDWIDFVLTAVIGGTAFLCLFEGTRRIAAQGANRRAALLAALGAAFYLIYGGFAYWQYLQYRQPLVPSAAAPSPAAGPAKGAAARPQTPERAEAAGLARARRAYLEKGLLEGYVDRKDEKKTFAPSQADLQRREQVVVAEVQREVVARASLYEILFWLVTACVAVVFGIGFSRDKSTRG
jgi:hypothetical protein